MSEKFDLKKEKKLIEKAKKDKEAFGLLYDLYVDDVYRFVLYKVRNKHLAEDIVSETFEKAIKKMRSFRWQGFRFSSWLYTIARNLVIDNSRKSKIEVSFEEIFSFTRDEEVESLEDKTDRKIHLKKLARELDKLSKDQQEIIYLRFIKELTIKETMDITGRTIDSVKSLSKRALKNLKNQFKNEYIDEN